MAIWRRNNSVITKIGEEILSKCYLGLGEITISRVVTGAGYIDPATLKSQVAVNNIKQELAIEDLSVKDFSSRLQLFLDNYQVMESYPLYQLGIYVTHPQYEGEQLYWIAQCDVDTVDVIPPVSELPYSASFGVVLENTSANVLNLNIDHSGFVTWEYYKRHGVFTVDTILPNEDNNVELNIATPKNMQEIVSGEFKEPTSDSTPLVSSSRLNEFYTNVKDKELVKYETLNNVKGKGSNTLPIYFDSKGVATPITSYRGNSATATRATNDGNGNNIINTYATKVELNNTNINVSSNLNKITVLQGYFDSSAKLKLANMQDSGVSAGSYGLSSNVSPSYSGKFNVPYLTVDRYGRVTKASTQTVTMPPTMSKQDIVNMVYPVGSVYISFVATNPSTFFGGTWVREALGRAIIGADDSTYKLGSTGGSATTTATVGNTALSVAQIPAHSHSGTALLNGSHYHSGTTSTNGAHYHGAMGESSSHSPFGKYDDRRNYWGSNGGVDSDNSLWKTSTDGNHNHTFNTSTDVGHTHSLSVNNTGSGATHTHSLSSISTMQPYVALYVWRRTA